MATLRLFFSELGPYRRSFLVICVIGALDGVVGFAIPAALSASLKSAVTADRLVLLIATLAALYAASLCLQWILRKHGEAFGPKFSLALRLRYIDAIERLPFEKLMGYHSGYILSLVGRVVEGLGSLAVAIFWGFTRTLVQVILFLVYLAHESAPLAAYNVFAFVFFSAVNVFLSRGMVAYTAKLNKTRAVLIAHYTDCMANILSVKKLAAMPFVSGLLTRATEQTEAAITEVQSAHARRWLYLHGIFSASVVLTLSAVLVSVSRGTTSSAVLILFLSAFVSLKSNADRLAENFRSVMELNAYLTDLEQIVSLERPRAPAPQPSPLPFSRLRLHHVSFRYPSRSIEIRIPNFELAPGEIVGIRGPSGEGKTTMLGLLANFLTPAIGDRYLDERPYVELDQAAFGRSVAMVSQDIDLLNISVRDNLCLGEPVTDEKLFELLDEVGLSHWRESLPFGLETIVGEKGITLSTGQKQRLALIRALLLDRPLCLLDEPTSQLDNRTQEMVLEFIEYRFKGKAVVIVSHRREIERICTRSYIMDQHVLRPEVPAKSE